MKRILALAMFIASPAFASDIAQPVYVVNCNGSDPSYQNGLTQPVTMTNICTTSVSGGGAGLTYSSFSATQPILYNNTTGAISATLISLSTGVTGAIASTASLPSYVAVTNANNNFSATQTIATSMTVNGAGGLGVTGGLLTTSFGISATTITVSSNTVVPGATFYFAAPIRMGGHIGSVGSMYINGGNLSGGTSNIIIGVPNGPTGGSLLTSGNTITCIGAGACAKVVTDATLVAVGDAAAALSSGTNNNTIMGSGAWSAATSGNQNTVIGRGSLGSSVSGSNNTTLGYQACINSGFPSSATVTGSMCLGYQSYVDGNNVMAVGGISVPITDVYWNSKSQTTNVAGSSITFHAQASSGTDKAGGDFVIAAGQSAGNGASGSIIFRISTTTLTGTRTNGLVSISSWTNAGLTMVNSNHYNVTGATGPALSSCGTNPTIIGFDSAFTITAGGSASGCVATFAKPFTAVPTCTVSAQSMSVVNALAYAVTATAVTLTQTSMTGNYDVVCIGHD